MFCDAINNGNVMTVSPSWESICKIENDRISRNLVDVYEEELLNEIKNKTLSKQELKRLHQKVKERMIKELHRKSLCDNLTSLEEEFSKSIQAKFKSISQHNQAKIEETLRVELEKRFRIQQQDMDPTDPKAVYEAIELMDSLVAEMQSEFNNESARASIYQYANDSLKNFCYEFVNHGVKKFLQKEKIINERLKDEEISHEKAKIDYENRLEENRITIQTHEKDRINLQIAKNILEKRVTDLEKEKEESLRTNDQNLRGMKENALQIQHLHEKEVEEMKKQLWQLEEGSQKRNFEIRNLEESLTHHQNLQSNQEKEYNREIKMLTTEINVLKIENLRLVTSNEEIRSAAKKAQEEESLLEKAKLENQLLRQRLADAEQALTLLRGENEKFKNGHQALKKELEAFEATSETDKYQYDEQMSALKSKSHQLESVNSSLVETNRNLTTILERTDVRCLSLEKKIEQSIIYEKMFKNISMLCCKACGNFYNCNLFASHLEICSKEYEKDNFKENLRAVSLKKEEGEEEAPRNNKAPEFKVLPRECREGQMNRGEFKIYIEYLGKEWHIVRSFKEIKSFIEETIKENREYQDIQNISELLKLNLPKENNFSPNLVEKLCNLIKNCLMILSQDTEMRKSRRFNRFVGLGDGKKEALNLEFPRKMLYSSNSKPLQQRRRTEENDSLYSPGKSCRTLEDNEIKELDEY